MRLRRKQKRNGETVSATELAEMGFCEKRVLLTHLHGERLTSEQLRSVDRGRKAHEQFYREGLSVASEARADWRCFVATCLYGESAWQTEMLRRFRDQVLQRSQLGCRMVEAYYVIAPGVCLLLVRLPWLQPPVRALVGALARVAQHAVEARRP